MKARAAILIAQGQPLVVDEIDVPSPTYGQVLVKLLCSGVCGSQLGEIAGVKGPDPYLPHLLGHEGVGQVLEVGEGVRTVSVCDRVALHWRPGNGLQGSVPVYTSAKLGRINAGWVTTFNEIAIVSENRVTRIPSHLDPALGTLFGCAVATGFGVVNNDAGVCIGESVVVFGAGGGVGLCQVLAAAMVSAFPIVAVDVVEDRLALARQLGATHTVNAADGSVEDAIREIVGEAGSDVCLENTGHSAMIEAAYRLTSHSGRTILVGVPRKGCEATLYTLPLHFGKRIVGSHGGQSCPDTDIPRLIRLMDAERLDLTPLLGQRYRLEQVNEALSDMREGRSVGRSIIVF